VVNSIAREAYMQKQIPFGNERKNEKGRSRFPSGMTERRATATGKSDGRLERC
jgi:hypothetical protein